MARATVPNIAVRGIVCAVPGEPIDVRALGSAFPPEDVDRIRKSVGLGTVHRVEPGVTTAGDLCEAAAERLLDTLGWDRASIDAVVMVTQNPDHFAPATACVLHGRLGLSDQCAAFDVNQGCAGYVYGMWLAAQMLGPDRARRVLLLAGDTSSVVASNEDRSVAMLFGDAGSATAIELDPTVQERMSFVVAADGSGAQSLVVPAGAYRVRPSAEQCVRTADADGNARSPSELYMDGLAVFNFTLKRVPPMVRDVLTMAEWQAADVPTYAFHQANAFILATLAKKLGLRAEQVPINIGKYGNTSVATIPLVLADAAASRLTSGEPTRVVLAGFGVGLSWAAATASMSLQVAEVVSV